MAFNLSYSDFDYRPVTMGDAAATMRWRNQKHVRDAMFSAEKCTPEGHRAWLQARIDSPHHRYFLFRMKGQPVGVFGFYNLDFQNGRGEWSFYMGDDRPSLPRGVGVAMWFFAVDAYFAERELHRLWSQVLATNGRVVSMHLKFGFQSEGKLREHVRKESGFIDVHCLSMLKTEWKKLRALRYRELFGDNKYSIAIPNCD